MEYLIYDLMESHCTPLLGAGASALWIPVARHIAKELAEEYEYPLRTDILWQKSHSL
jgi:hypothetical protein